MKKILYIGGFELPDKNAAAHRVMANAKLLKENGFGVSFIGVTKDPKKAPNDIEGFVCKHINYPSNIKTWIYQIVTFVDPKMIFEEHPDYVILYNFPSIASLKIIHACHKNNIKVICDLTEWEMAYGFTPRILIKKLDIWLRMHHCIPKMDGVIAISKYLYDYYKEKTPCVYIPPTVDLSDPKWNRGRGLCAHDKVQLIYAGTGIGDGNKDRLDFVIESIKDKPNIELTVVGMTKEEYIQSYGKGVPNCVLVTFKGRVSHNEAVEAVQNADFQVLIRQNNLKNNAGFPTKFVESFSCCTPLIATQTSNICDYLRDGENGILVKDIHALEGVMKKVELLPKEEIVKMKKACQKVQAFDYRNYKDVINTLFL